jgi:hypothetical protein
MEERMKSGKVVINEMKKGCKERRYEINYLLLNLTGLFH